MSEQDKSSTMNFISSTMVFYTNNIHILVRQVRCEQRLCMRLQRFRVFEDLISSLEKVFVRIPERDHSVTKIGERGLNVITRGYVAFVDAADDVPYAIIPPSVPLLCLHMCHSSLMIEQIE
jgi:hypothetical protein